MSLAANIERWALQHRAKLTAAMADVMRQLAEWVQTEHSYQDQTGDTTASIQSRLTEVTAGRIVGVISAGMDYDVFLELARSGQWSFIWVRIVAHADDILALIAEGGKGGGEVVGSAGAGGWQAPTDDAAVMSQYETFKAAMRKGSG